MKKSDTELRDIYRAEDSRNEETTPLWTVPDQIAREIRQQRIFNFFIGLLLFSLIAALAFAGREVLTPRSPEVVLEGARQPYIASYTLPADEQWAIEYRQVAQQADGSEPAGPKDLSSKWIKNAAYHIIMGEQALRANDPKAAQEHLELTVETYPVLTGARRFLGEVYLKQQDFPRAAEQLQKALEEERSVDVLNNLGAACLGLGEYARAENLLKEALQKQPACAGCYKNLAILYQQTGNMDMASAAFEKYFLFNPQDTPLLEAYTKYLADAGRIRDVLGFLNQISGADPLELSLLKARTQAQSGDAQGAVAALRDAATRLPPHQMIEKMHDPVFDSISSTEPFEALVYRLELAKVSLSTNLNSQIELKY